MLPFWDEVSRRFYRQLRAPRGAKMLDLGAGRGTLVRLARADGVDAHGVEPFWPEPIDPHIVRGFAENLPFEDASFDLVTCFSVLESVEDPAQVLREAARVVREDGRLVFAVPELESYPRLNRERYTHVTGSRWFRSWLAHVPQLTVRRATGFGIRFLVPIAKRTIVRAAPRVAPRALAAVYARRFPRSVCDLTIWTLSR